MKVNISEKVYQPGEVASNEAAMVAADHWFMYQDNKKRGGYETFGEWKKANPDHPMAKMPWPNNEFVLNMSTRYHYDYFVRTYGTKPKSEFELD